MYDAYGTYDERRSSTRHLRGFNTALKGLNQKEQALETLETRETKYQMISTADDDQ